MSYITTYTKIHFEPLDPKSEQIKIEDIAHALSLLCRANGHFGTFFSVAQHSINCMKEARARGYTERVQLGCLLHDASEAYLSDITRPVKSELPKYKDIEKNLQDMIFAKWIENSLTEEEEKQVFCVDDAMLYCEFKHFMNEELFDYVPEIKSVPDFSVSEFRKTENEFIRCFENFTGEEKSFLTVGVDWKKPHWLAVAIDGKEITSKKFGKIKELCEYYNDADAILVDIPVGLPESKEDAEKRPDKEARRYLANGRKSSVFNVLFRQLVYAKNKAEAWKLSDELGAGMTSVGYGLCEMIRDVDEFLLNHPEYIKKIRECHPEVAFQLLNNGKGLSSKHTTEGINERIAVLEVFGVDLSPILKQYSTKNAEDVLDAACLALSAQLGCKNGFFTIPENPTCDSKGLPMQMVFGKTE